MIESFSQFTNIFIKLLFNYTDNPVTGIEGNDYNL
jgi:hypothetical protein